MKTFLFYKLFAKLLVEPAQSKKAGQQEIIDLDSDASATPSPPASPRSPTPSPPASPRTQITEGIPLAEAAGSTNTLPEDVSEASVPEPVVPEPLVPEPLVPEPLVPEPLVPEPFVPEPLVPESHVPENVSSEPDVPEHVETDVQPEGVQPEHDDLLPPEEDGVAPADEGVVPERLGEPVSSKLLQINVVSC